MVNTFVSEQVRCIRWDGEEPPTEEEIRLRMLAEGINPHVRISAPNERVPMRSYNYPIVVYCVEGSAQFSVDGGKVIRVRPGDRLEIGRGVEYSVIIGPYGARCLEGIFWR